MDGNYIASLLKRINYANKIIYLEIPLYKSLLRIISRMIKYRDKDRPDMGRNCKEKLNPQFIQFLLWTVKFNFKYKKIIKRILSGTEYEVLKDKTAIDNYKNDLIKI